MVGHTDEIFIEPAELERGALLHGEIAAHELLNFPTLGRGKLLRRPRHIGVIVIPRLQNAAGHQPRPGAMALPMGAHELLERNDVVVQKEHDVVMRLEQTDVHCLWD